MFDDLRDLYQEVILDHGRKPRNFRRLENATHHARGDNPLCGDKMDLWLAFNEDGSIADAAFQGRGCAISMASASLMTETVRGKTPAQAKAMGAGFRELAMTGHCPACDAALEEDMERLTPSPACMNFPAG